MEKEKSAYKNMWPGDALTRNTMRNAKRLNRPTDLKMVKVVIKTAANNKEITFNDKTLLLKQRPSSL